MQNEIIHITEPDMECLRKLLKAEKRIDKSGRDDLQNWEAKLDQSQLIAQREVPKDVITLNSKIRLTDLGTGEEMSIRWCSLMKQTLISTKFQFWLQSEPLCWDTALVIHSNGKFPGG